MANEYIRTNGEGKQQKISEVHTNALRKDIKKVKAKFKREGRRLKAICDELNRRNKKRLPLGSSHIYRPHVVLNQTIGQMFSTPYVVNEDMQKLEAIFNLALQILESDNFDVENDMPILVQVLKQGRSKHDN